MADAPIIRWSRIFGVLIAGVALVEIGCRLILWQWAGQPYNSLSPYIWSPYGLMRNNPLLTSSAFHINANGFRDFGNYAAKKPPGTFRVLMLGGSTLYSGNGGVGLPGVPRVGSGDTIAQFLRKDLEADPELVGLTIEVLNAGVNYNRIVEVSGAYLGEFMYWQPDFIIVMSSANDFTGAPRVGSGDSNFFHGHPWEKEFEYQVNGRGFFAILDRTVRSLQEASAILALMGKVVGKFVDMVVPRVSALAERLAPNRPSPHAQTPPLAAPDAERWIREYLAHIGAIAEAATEQGQRSVFVWEYYLGQLKGRKPFSADEDFLFDANKSAFSQADATFRDEVRNRLSSYVAAKGAQFVDPLPFFRNHSQTVFTDYVHYTIDGNRVMAGVIYESIKVSVHRRAADIARASVGVPGPRK